MLSSAQFQWETVDQSKLHNSEISNAFFFFLVSYIGGWKVRGFVFQVKACACMLVSVHLTGEEQSDILQLFFTTNSHKPKHSNLHEVVSMLGDDVCGNFIKNNIGPSRVSFRVISTHLDGCWLFFVGVGICWPRTITNFNITLFRPRAGVQPEVYILGFFSRTVSNSHPYGVVANSTKQHRMVLASANLHPYGLYKQTTFWTLRSRVLHL